LTLLKNAPAFWQEGPAYAPELMTKHTAAMLARRIQKFWKDKGYTVNCRVESFAGAGSDRGLWFVVRSDMRNGWPRG
jgi:hypothetical protein